MKVLVTGAAGMLGTDVVRAAQAQNHEVVAIAHADLDVADEAGVAFIKGPDFFFHGGGDSAMRLAFSYERPQAIDEGISRLGRLVRDGLAVAA